METAAHRPAIAAGTKGDHRVVSLYVADRPRARSIANACRGDPRSVALHHVGARLHNRDAAGLGECRLGDRQPGCIGAARAKVAHLRITEAGRQATAE
jgi:hypothetical protein